MNTESAPARCQPGSRSGGTGCAPAGSLPRLQWRARHKPTTASRLDLAAVGDGFTVHCQTGLDLRFRRVPPAASVHSPWADRSSSSRCLVVVGVLVVAGGFGAPAGHQWRQGATPRYRQAPTPLWACPWPGAPSLRDRSASRLLMRYGLLRQRGRQGSTRGVAVLCTQWWIQTAHNSLPNINRGVQRCVRSL